MKRHPGINWKDVTAYDLWNEQHSDNEPDLVWWNSIIGREHSWWQPGEEDILWKWLEEWAESTSNYRARNAHLKAYEREGAMSRQDRQQHAQNNPNLITVYATKVNYNYAQMTPEEVEIAGMIPISHNKRAQRMMAGQYEQLVTNPETGERKVVLVSDEQLRKQELQSGTISKHEGFCAGKRKFVIPADGSQPAVSTAQAEAWKRINEQSKAANRKAIGNEQPRSHHGSSPDSHGGQGHSTSPSSHGYHNRSAQYHSGYYNQSGWQDQSRWQDRSGWQEQSGGGGSSSSGYNNPSRPSSQTRRPWQKW